MIGLVLALGAAAFVIFKKPAGITPAQANALTAGKGGGGLAIYAAKRFAPVDNQAPRANGTPCQCPPGTPDAGKTSAYSTVYGGCICGQTAAGSELIEYVGHVAYNTAVQQTGTGAVAPKPQ